MTGGIVVAIVAVWLVCGALAAIVANAKRRDPVLWGAIGLLTGVLGLLAIVGMPVAEPQRPKVQQARHPQDLPEKQEVDAQREDVTVKLNRLAEALDAARQKGRFEQ